MERYRDATGKFAAQLRGNVSHTPSQARVRAVTAKALPSLYRELCSAVPNADVLLVFYEWQGILVQSTVLGRSVWVVRSHADGVALAQDTGLPALTLDDVLKVKGRSAEEARAILSPALITAPVQG